MDYQILSIIRIKLLGFASTVVLGSGFKSIVLKLSILSHDKNVIANVHCLFVTDR
jgi:hypothetical protein